jgi:hypothetical protein
MKVQCGRCEVVGSRPNIIAHILRTHVDKAQVPYTCALCEYRAGSRGELVRHTNGYKLHLELSLENPDVDDDTYYKQSANPYMFTDRDIIRIERKILIVKKEEQTEMDVGVQTVMEEEAEVERVVEMEEEAEVERVVEIEEEAEVERVVEIEEEDAERIVKHKQPMEIEEREEDFVPVYESQVYKDAETQTEYHDAVKYMRRRTEELEGYVARLREELKTAREEIEKLKPVVGATTNEALRGFEDMWEEENQEPEKTKMKSVVRRVAGRTREWKSRSERARDRYNR